MDTTLLITSFVTLFVIVHPLGLTQFFLFNARVVKKSASFGSKKICHNCICHFVTFRNFWRNNTQFYWDFHASFQYCRGNIIILTALEILFQKRKQRREAQGNEALASHNDPSVFPLAVPLISGPGSIASIILLSQTHTGMLGFFELALIICATMLVTYLFFSATTYFNKYLSPTFIDVVTRILGMLLAALATQFIMDGIHSFNGH